MSYWPLRIFLAVCDGRSLSRVSVSGYPPPSVSVSLPPLPPFFFSSFFAPPSVLEKDQRRREKDPTKPDH